MYFSGIFKNVVKLLIISLLTCQLVSSENILFYIGPLASYSHRFGLEPLAIEMASKGHNVTILSPVKQTGMKLGDPHPNPNITEICPLKLFQLHETTVQEFSIKALYSILNAKEIFSPFLVLELIDIVHDACRLTLGSPEIQNYIHQNQTFDLIIMDNAMNECAYALAHKFKAKTMSYTSVAPNLGWDYDFFGLPHESSWYPILGTLFQGKEMPLSGRILNTFSSLIWYFLLMHKLLPSLEPICKELLAMPQMPPLDHLKMQQQVMLSNQHFSDSFARSIPPFVVPIGGMHLKNTVHQLPKDLSQFLYSQEGDNGGFVYVSFGSVVIISAAPTQVVRAFFDAFKELSQIKFLWKWEKDTPPKGVVVSKNVMLKSWFPQEDILAHPKILGFITQGGQVSHQQAIFHGVPLVVIPVLADQHVTAIRTRTMGNGVDLPLQGLTTQILVETLTKFLANESHVLKAEELKKLSRDRIMSPLVTAKWWTEFVLRHKDLSLLKPLSATQPWWKVRLVDVWLMVFGLFLFAGIFVFLNFFWLLRMTMRQFGRDQSASDKVKRH